jgi:diadenosine tetraphosphate (Ap4A) HIT family hydrolase
MSDCIFCDIIAGRAEASVVYQDAAVCAFMDIQPVNPGHVLLVPARHAASLVELRPDQGAQVFAAAQRVAGALRAAAARGRLRCEGVNLFLADGEAAGQEVFHVHLHVLPRFAGDGFGFTFPAGYMELPPRAELEAAAQALRAGL